VRALAADKRSTWSPSTTAAGAACASLRASIVAATSVCALEEHVVRNHDP
jgi:hypothetical protein